MPGVSFALGLLVGLLSGFFFFFVAMVLRDRGGF